MSQSPPAEQRKSWRGGPDRSLIHRSRNVWRYILSGLSLVLLGLMIWWLIPRPAPRVLLLTFSDQREDRHILPPVPFAQDIEALTAWARAVNVPVCQLALTEIDKLRRWADRPDDRTASELEFTRGEDGKGGSVSPKGGDTLIVYIKGHGLAVDLGAAGQPDVQPILIKQLTDTALAGDWLRDGEAIVNVGKLLTELAARKDVRSVLILDAVHLGYDPRLGVLANAFPDAVREAVQKALPPEAANVWVVLGSASGELSASDPATGRSVLVSALTAALEQQADEDDRIDLESLVREVATSVARQPRGLRDALALAPQLIEPPGAASSRPKSKAQLRPLLPQAIPPKPDGKKAVDPKEVVIDQAAKAAKDAAARGAQSVGLPTSPLPGIPAPGTGTIQLAGQQPPAPATTPAPATAGTTAGAQPPAEPGATPPTAPPAVAAPATAATAAPAPATSAPPELDDSQSVNLHLAWQLRDRLLRGSGSAASETWSPIHVAPHWWRRLESILVGYDEQVIGSRSASVSDPQTLRLLIADLQNLAAAIEGGAAVPSGPECREIAAAFRQFSAGAGAANRAQQSFDSRAPGGLDVANAALKTFAEGMFRAADYVRLHGRLASVTDGGPPIETSAGDLLAALYEMRGKLDPRGSTDGRLDDGRIQAIERQAAQLRDLRDRLDSDIAEYVRSIAAAPLSAGKLLRIRLMIESPLLGADDRRLLRRAVLAQSAAVPIAAGGDGTSTTSRGSSASNLPARLRANAGLVRSLLRLAEPLAGPDGVQPSGASVTGNLALQLTESKLPRGAEATNLLRWVSVGREMRAFDEALPRQIQNDYVVRRAKLPEPAPADMFGLYLSLLLVDGRDAGRFPRSAPLVSLAQPLLPARIPDLVQLTADPPELQLALDDRQGAELRLALAVQTESPPPHQVTLNLQWSPAADVKIVRDGTGEEILPGALPPLSLEGNQRTIAFRVIPRRQDDSAQSAKVTFTARATFAKAQAAEARATCLLPRPDRIDFSVVSLRAIDRAGERWGGDQGGRLMLFANRAGTYQLSVRNLSSEARKLHARLYRVPARAAGASGRLFHPRSPTSLMKPLADMDRRIRETTTGTPTDLRDLLIAQTGEKTPLDLPANQSQSVMIPLEAVSGATPTAAAAPGAGPPRTDVTSGLVLVLSSADGQQHQPYVKWIELAPYLPDDLFEIRRPLYQRGRLSFSVGLKDARLADELGLTQQPVKIQWDRQTLPPGVGEGKFEALLEPENREPELWANVPESAAWPLYVQLHVDDYPRALVSQLERDLSGGVKQNNWKRDRLPVVHLGRLGLAHAKTIYEFKPQESWLPFPAPLAQLPEGFRVLPRQRTDASPIYAAIGTQQEIPVTVDLLADVAPTYFADGATLQVQVGTQPELSFGFDRRVNVGLAGLDGGGLKLENQVGDWTNLSLPIRVEANQDRRVEIAAEISDGAARSDVSRHRALLVLDRNAPEVSPAEAQPSAVNPAAKPRIMLRCRATDGRDGSGVERVEFVVGFDQNGNNRLDEPERQPAWPATGEGLFYQAEIGLTDDKKEGTYLVEAVAYDRAGHRGVAPSLGAFEARIPPPAAKNRSTFGGSKEKDEPVVGKQGK